MSKMLMIFPMKKAIGYKIHLEFYNNEELEKETYEYALTRKQSIVKVVDDIYWAKKKLGYDDIRIFTNIGDLYKKDILLNAKLMYGIDLGK